MRVEKSPMNVWLDEQIRNKKYLDIILDMGGIIQNLEISLEKYEQLVWQTRPEGPVWAAKDALAKLPWRKIPERNS